MGYHPFITTCYECFQNASSLFFAMELAPGGDLFGLLDMFPHGLQETQARFYVMCVALALRHVHAHGWVYRDVKLENVLIDSDGYIKSARPSRPPRPPCLRAPPPCSAPRLRARRFSLASFSRAFLLSC